MKIAVPNDPSHKLFNYAWAKLTPISVCQISMGNCVLIEVVLALVYFRTGPRVPKIEFDDIKWNGNPKIIINNLFQNISQAVFCLGSQKREEIRTFSSRLQSRSFQLPALHCVIIQFLLTIIAISSIGARLWDWDMNIHDSDVTRLSASALYDFCTFHTKVKQCHRRRSCDVTTHEYSCINPA